MKQVRGIFQKRNSDVFWVRYVDGFGRYRREKAGSWAQANKLLAKRRAEALQRKKLPETLRQRTVLFSEIADIAIAYSKAHKVDKSETVLARLKEWFGFREAEALTTQEIERRLQDEAAARKWAGSTHNHYRNGILLAFREGRRAGKVTSANPARDVRHQKEDNSRVRFLSDAEEKRLRRVIQTGWPEHLQEFEFAISTGLRKGSMYSLTWSMVDWTGRMLNIPTSKNGEPLHLPLNAAALAALRKVYEQGSKTGRVFESAKTGEALKNSRHWFDDALVEAEIVDFVWHDLRHHFASKLRQAGAKLEDIAELLGHKGLTMTKRYSHLGPNQLHKVAALFDAANSTPVAPQSKQEEATPVRYLN